jgi:hypothetical protein
MSENQALIRIELMHKGFADTSGLTVDGKIGIKYQL